MRKVTFIVVAMFAVLTSGKLFTQINFNGTPSKVSISMNAQNQKMDYLSSDYQTDVLSSEVLTGRRKVVTFTWSAIKLLFVPQKRELYPMVRPGKARLLYQK